jgi:hypothetical protein
MNTSIQNERLSDEYVMNFLIYERHRNVQEDIEINKQKIYETQKLRELGIDNCDNIEMMENWIKRLEELPPSLIDIIRDSLELAYQRKVENYRLISDNISRKIERKLKKEAEIINENLKRTQLLVDQLKSHTFTFYWKDVKELKYLRWGVAFVAFELLLIILFK